MRFKCGVFPLPFQRNAHSAVGRWRHHSHNVKLIFIGCEWFVAQYFFRYGSGLAEKAIHIFLSVTLGKNGYIYRFAWVAATMDITVLGGISSTDSDQFVGRTVAVG